MAVPQMPYGNASNAIWQSLDCHMAVPPLSMAVSYCQMAVASLLLAVSCCSCNSYSYCNVPVRVPNTLEFLKLALKLLLLFINVNYRLLFLLGCHHNHKRHAIGFAKNECAFTSYSSQPLMTVTLLPCGSVFIVIWQFLNCHMAMSPLSLAALDCCVPSLFVQCPKCSKILKVALKR